MDTVIIVPGNMGSHLSDANSGTYLWINPFALARGKFADLQLGPYTGPQMEVDSPGFDIVTGPQVTLMYGHLNKALQQEGYNTQFFAYDWRKDIDSVAQNLANLIDSFISPTSKVHLLAHSEGGMVARRGLQQLWAQKGDQYVLDNVGKLILLGPSTNGTHIAALGLFGATNQIPIFQYVPTLGQNLQATLKTFTSLYQLLPFDDTIFSSLKIYNLRKISFWQGKVDSNRLDRAFPSWTSSWGYTVNTQFFKDHTTVIVGYTPNSPTVGGVYIDSTGNMVIDHKFDLPGDGFMTHLGSILPDTKTYVADGVEHILLPIDGAVNQAIYAILNGQKPTTVRAW